jgi:SAM-dependent methyltransferase
MAPTVYDDVPYPSVPFPQTHPDRLAALATLFGMRTAPVERCRVLELGCGDGGNLIPMALVLPESRFLGLDLAGEPIGRGRATIDVLGLSNVELRQEDLRDFAKSVDAEQDPFDFIVAHGVYSWVPGDVREALLSICQRWLAPHGVAYVSYNAYPGCHIRDMVRQMLLYHAAGTNDSRVAIARARGLARMLADVLPEMDELAFLRNELRQVTERSPSVLFHDDLAPENRPFHFYELMERAGAHGLQYLAEADFHEMGAHGFPPRLVEILDSIERERGLVAREQYLDFLKVRRFRQTLLCHADVTLDRAGLAERVEQLSVASPVAPATDQPNLRPGVVEELRGPRGSVIQIDLPLAKAALLELGAAWPRRLPFRELRSRADARLAGLGVPPAGEDGDQARALAEIVLEAYGAGVLQFHTFMPSVAFEPGERPAASPLVRLQLERGDGSVVSTLLHTTLRIDDLFGRYALSLLDGTRDGPALLRELRRWVRQHRGAGPTTEDASSIDLSPASLAAQLRELGRRGLLVA